MHTPSFLALLSALLVLILPTPQEIASFAPKMGAAEDAQEGARGSPRWPGQWNLARLDERYHAAIRKVELRDYEGALGLLKELKRESSREKWKKDERGRLKFLTKISTELRAVGRATMKKRLSHRDLETARALTFKNRNTFAFLHFMGMENTIRGRLGIGRLHDFEPPSSAYEALTRPFDFFSEVTHRLTIELGDRITEKPGRAMQGRYAYHYRDSLADRRMMLSLPVGSLQNAWPAYRYLCFNARIEKPKDANLHVRCVVEEVTKEYFLLKCGSWKGWKQHRIDFRKIGLPSDKFAGLTWANVYSVDFSVEGGISDLYLDDIHLCK